MSRIRTSKIWLESIESFSDLIKRSNSSREVLSYFGLENKGGNNKTLWKRISEEDLDTSHFNTLSKWQKSGMCSKLSAKSLEDILVPDSSYSRFHLKKRLLRENLLENKCQICGLLPEWNGKSLTLRLDHINGKSRDNRIENLRLVCPNCDSQLETFSGRNLKNARSNRAAGATTQV